jgi:hypothetical protein
MRNLQGTSVGLCFQGKSCVMGLMHMIGIVVPSSCMQFISAGMVVDKLLPLPQPPVRARTDARMNPSAQRATQLRRVLARVYAVSIQNQITNTVP